MRFKSPMNSCARKSFERKSAVMIAVSTRNDQSITRYVGMSEFAGILNRNSKVLYDLG